jgi:hypothetical protein
MEQVAIAAIRRLLRSKGQALGEIKIPVAEIDDTGKYTLSFSATPDNKHFIFKLGKLN